MTIPIPNFIVNRMNEQIVLETKLPGEPRLALPGTADDHDPGTSHPYYYPTTLMPSTICGGRDIL
ncbi:hypothetical protein IWQ49_001065 [Labrenzia sp. EL_126]|nr:hypothetical protein [Labrenzia sp. EL_126]